jgi:hypothetical protein
MGNGSDDGEPDPSLPPGSDDPVPDEQRSPSETASDRWLDAISPSGQSPELRDDIDKLLRHAVDLTSRFLLVPFIAAAVVIGLAILFLTAGIAVYILMWFGLLRLPSSPVTIVRIVSPAGLVVIIAGVGRLWLSLRRRRRCKNGKGRHRRR